jgi:3-carboxy-cis,cis-muconate cycloisomerase
MSADSPLLDPLFRGTPAAGMFSDVARLDGMLEFEAALARAAANVGVIPNPAARVIVECCRAELFDLRQIGAAAASAGNPAIPLVAALTELVAQKDGESAGYVHWGATSQDVMDTGLVLRLRQALDQFLPETRRLADELATLASAHAGTLIAGRTWLQHAVPITFGLKAAGWCAAVDRARTRVEQAGDGARVLQFGGAAGSLASVGDAGPAMAAALAAELHLREPELSWHAHRDRLVDLAAALALLAGVLGKIARDVSLLMQTEVSEVSEPAAHGRGGSSTMPHKRNPVACAVMLSAAARVPNLLASLFAAMPQEHERGLGGWHAEWEMLPEIFSLTWGSLNRALETIEGLEVFAERMRTNIDLTRGLMSAEAVMMALAPRMGRDRAHEIVEEASRTAVRDGVHLRDVLAKTPSIAGHLDPTAVDTMFDYERQAFRSKQLVERMLASRQRSQGVS